MLITSQCRLRSEIKVVLYTVLWSLSCDRLSRPAYTINGKFTCYDKIQLSNYLLVDLLSQCSFIDRHISTLLVHYHNTRRLIMVLLTASLVNTARKEHDYSSYNHAFLARALTEDLRIMNI